LGVVVCAILGKTGKMNKNNALVEGGGVSPRVGKGKRLPKKKRGYKRTRIFKLASKKYEWGRRSKA